MTELPQRAAPGIDTASFAGTVAVGHDEGYLEFQGSCLTVYPCMLQSIEADITVMFLTRADVDIVARRHSWNFEAGCEYMSC